MKNVIDKKELIPQSAGTVVHIYSGAKIHVQCYWHKETDTCYWDAFYRDKNTSFALCGLRKKKPSESELRKIAEKKGVIFKRRFVTL